MTHVKLRFLAFLVAALALLPSGARAFCYSLPSSGVPIYEYVNDVTGRYVLLWSGGEIATIDAGSAETGWHRTGNVFGGAGNFCYYFGGFFNLPMCRFYAPSINAHFLTARTSECDGLRRNTGLGWIFERDDMQVFVPTSGCGRYKAVNRFYSGASSASGVAHRYTADPRVGASLLAQGWIDEGVEFCSVDDSVQQAIYEYANDETGHYLLLWDPAEIATIDAGSAQTKWHRTGYVFGAFSVRPNIVPGFRLCRFYAPSINAHFLTARAVECDGLRAIPGSGWIYERNDVSVHVPDAAGECGGYLQTPVHRLHSDVQTAGGVGYRHTADPSIRAALLAQGWTDEGVAFCAASYSAPH